jgi:hypothetical protein
VAPSNQSLAATARLNADRSWNKDANGVSVRRLPERIGVNHVAFDLISTVNSRRNRRNSEGTERRRFAPCLARLLAFV